MRVKRDRLVASEQLIGIQVWFGSLLSSWQVRVRSYARTSTWHDSNLQIILVYSRCCISFIEYLIVSYYRYLMYRGFTLSFQVPRRRANRTTLACNAHCCLVGQLYIEYDVYSIYNGSNFVTTLPSWKYTWFHSRVDISGNTLTGWCRSKACTAYQELVKSFCCRMC